MELTIKERIVLLNILPKEGNVITLKLVRKFREALSFSETEIKEGKIKIGDGQINWDDSVLKSKDVKVEDTIKSLIVKSLRDLDQKEKLTEEHISLYEKFVEGEQNAI